VGKAFEVECLITTEDKIETVGICDSILQVVVMTVESDVIELKF
jgi:hypothetical protein